MARPRVMETRPCKHCDAPITKRRFEWRRNKAFCDNTCRANFNWRIWTPEEAAEKNRKHSRTWNARNKERKAESSRAWYFRNRDISIKRAMTHKLMGKYGDWADVAAMLMDAKKLLFKLENEHEKTNTRSPKSQTVESHA